MPYKARYLFDGDLTDELGGETLAESTASNITWEAEDSAQTYKGLSSYKYGTSANSAGGNESANISNSSPSDYHISTSSLSNWSGNFTVCFWFRPDTTTFNAQGLSTGDAIVLFKSASSLSADESDAFAIVAAVGLGSTVDSISVVLSEVVQITALGVLGDTTTMINGGSTEAYWYFVCVTHDGSDVNIYVNDNEGDGDFSKSISSTSGTGSWGSTIQFYEYILANSTVSGQGDQFVGAFSSLRIFNEVLSVSEINNIYQADALDGTTYGDVHVNPWLGLPYTFHNPSYYRLFDNGSDLTINVHTSYCKHPRWSQNDYVDQIYIKYGDKSMIIDPGFRGQKAKIIKNDGIEYEDKETPLNKIALIYCFDCRFKTESDYRRKNHAKCGHTIPANVRNQITIPLRTDTGNFIFIVTNVNEYNLQPVNITLLHNAKNNVNYKGYIVHKKYSLQQLKDINDITPLN